jgi:RNA polymerase sigma-70 factor (ECF subfamily)
MSAAHDFAAFVPEMPFPPKRLRGTRLGPPAGVLYAGRTQPFRRAGCPTDNQSLRLQPPEPVDDAELIGRILAGDPGAERELYEAHVDRVYRLVYRLVGESDRTEDYTQDTFIRVFDRLHTFQYRSALGTWIIAIALSVTLNGLRKIKRIRNREQSWDQPPEIAAAGFEMEPDLRARRTCAIDELPEGYRTVFVMHEIEGYTHEEIGTALGVRPGTSKAQLFRARARLRSMLAEFMKE